MDIREILVDDLCFGMYVAQLDRPWTDTPFMFQGFVLRTEKQLEALKKYCRKVYVDPEKYDRGAGRAVGEVVPAFSSMPRRPRVDPTMQIRGKTEYPEITTVETEFPRARRILGQSSALVARIGRSALVHSAIDSKQTQSAARAITASVVRNPDAMMLLAKLEEKGGATLSRAVEVSVMMTVFGRFLQFPVAQLTTLSLLGLLQDIGKVRLPATLLEKTEPYTRDEEAIYRTHIAHSVEILSHTAGLPADFPGLASLHHERYDGSGYPRGLRGNAIALPGAIAGLVDAFDTLVAPEPFGVNLIPSAAFGVLYRNRGEKFAPGLVEQFIQCLGAYPVGSVIEMETGEVGMVIAQNAVRRLQPRVLLVQDATGNPILPRLVLDLLKEPIAADGEVYRIRRTLDSGCVKIDAKELFL